MKAVNTLFRCATLLPSALSLIVLTGCTQEKPAPSPSAQKNLKELGKQLDEFKHQQREAGATGQESEIAHDGPLTPQDWQSWTMQWNNAITACESHNGSAERIVIGPPAALNEIESLEQELGTKLPDSLRYVLTTYSGEVRLSWELVDEVERPDAIRDIFSGGISWSLEAIRAAEQERRDWQQNSFSNPDDEYDAVWHHKLGFLIVPNGDVIAFDLQGGDDPPVVYLSHEGGKYHGYRLGDNFIDFVTRWTRLGCPGPEEWQLSPFLTEPESGLVADSENVREWRTWFGMQ